MLGRIHYMPGSQSTVPTTSLPFISELEVGRVVLGDTPAKLAWKKFAVGPGTSTEVDTLWDLPASAYVYDVLIEVTTAEVTGSTKTLDVGLLSTESGGDADGFVDGVSVAATGVYRGGVALDGGSAYFDTTTRGALLRLFVQGAGTDDRGLYAERPHRAGAVTAKSVSYSRGSTLSEFVGNIWILYSEVA